jgi:hypothetical protein
LVGLFAEAARFFVVAVGAVSTTGLAPAKLLVVVCSADAAEALITLVELEGRGAFETGAVRAALDAVGAALG